MKATACKYNLQFRKPSGTSRGILTEKETWFILIERDGKRGIGECGILRGLSADDRPDYREKVKWTCDNIELGEEALWDALIEFPSIQFGVEMAFRSLESENPFVLFPSGFTDGMATIPINGLVWMGSDIVMKEQVEEKIAEGFSCIKLKIGALEFKKELDILRFIRDYFTPEEIEIRVDANGGFLSSDASDKLIQLSAYKIHSIEQPIAVKQHDALSSLCRTTPLPIALDEELIGVFKKPDKRKLLTKIRPHFIILKPSFIGGFRGTMEWIELAEELEICWWITSALESNIGLNAIAQWTFMQDVSMPQGLGTGGLFTNNFDSPLEVRKGELCYNPDKTWPDIVKLLSDKKLI